MEKRPARSTPISFTTFLKRYRYAYSAGFLILLVTNCFALAIPWVLKLAIDDIQGMGVRADVGFLNQCALVILFFALAHALLRVLSRVIIFGAGRHIEREIRQIVYEHVQRLDAAFYDRNPIGELVSLLTNDTNVARLFFGMGFLNLVNGTLLYILAAALMLFLNPWLALWAMLPYVLFIFILRKAAPHFHIESRRVQAEIANLTEFVHENLSGQEVLRAYASGDTQESRFLQVNERYLHASMRLTKVRGLLFTSTGAIGGLGTLILLWVGGQQVIQKAISLGDFVAFFGFLTLMVMPTLMFGFVISIWNRGRASLERIQDLLDQEPQVQEPIVSHPVKNPGNIQINNLSFAYPKKISAGVSEKVLKNVSLTIRRGELTALVGAIGSGKSTLISLLAKFYPVPNQTVCIEGQDINDLSLQDLRSLFAVIPQETFLFSMDVRGNIAFGSLQEQLKDPAVFRERIASVSRMAQVGLASGETPIDLDTKVGERGVLLSGGQKQRIGIARALNQEAPYLILDDPFSSLDSQTARKILTSIQQRAQSQTILLVTHKISLVKQASNIFVMDQGQIVDFGSHATLFSRCKTYQDLYALEELEGENGQA